MSSVRVATRGSDLALAQAHWVTDRISDTLGVQTELLVVRTTGDRMKDVSLAKIGGKGLFIKELEEALLAGEADVAIHSAKDLPAEIPEDLVLAAFPQRADPRDALVASAPEMTLESLPQGVRVGTGSTRRTALLLAARPDLQIVPLRGNVPTRIAKLQSEDLAAVVLACAGLDRLGLSDDVSERIATNVMLPAVCQGVLALEGRAGETLCDDLAQLTPTEVATSVAAERSFLRHIGGDCTTPMAAHCEVSLGGRIELRGLVATLDGKRIVRADTKGEEGDAEALGRQLAETVLASGGRKILDELRAAEAAELHS